MNRIKNHPILDFPKDRKRVKFYFNDKELFGFENEMVSSTLIANGIKEFSIHQKNDMPQGIFCANGQCSKCTLIIDGISQKSCITPLKRRYENKFFDTSSKITGR